ncbi:hypothetical protein BofuT4_P082780.1 [Botrytis cinerea T4]|uniref:Uncharacterized protein n=1 Tax=Botryotinia fuckeliana (strain T4) TaxID=999810 RepID=G2YKH1_BOTF4|nr:hypothetical protein BofuT4_P082780.1 [Botrytis cinerea T4]
MCGQCPRRTQSTIRRSAPSMCRYIDRNHGPQSPLLSECFHHTFGLFSDPGQSSDRSREHPIINFAFPSADAVAFTFAFCLCLHCLSADYPCPLGKQENTSHADLTRLGL